MLDALVSTGPMCSSSSDFAGANGLTAFGLKGRKPSSNASADPSGCCQGANVVPDAVRRPATPWATIPTGRSWGTAPVGFLIRGSLAARLEVFQLGLPPS